MISIVAFDADDTLWHTESLFQETQARLATILDRYAPHADVAARLNLTERRNLRQFGYGIKGFILSMVETAIEISDSRVSAAEIHEIMMMGKAMLDAPLQLMEDVDAVLDALGAAYRLFLITKGDMLDQRTKIDRSGLADRFAHIEVVSEKDARTYRAIFAAHRVEPAQAMMVGNSVPSDILPILEIGGHAVHIPYHVTADIERHSDLPTHPHFHQLTRIADLPALISRLDREKR